MASRYDNAPLQTPLDVNEPRWRLWFQKVWEQLQNLGLPLPSAIVVGASPFVYQWTGGGQVSVVVSAATLVETSRDGTNWFTCGGATANMYTMSQGDYLRVTHGGAAVMTLFLR